MSHLILFRKFTTQEKAERACRELDKVMPALNTRAIFLGPGRYPWGVVAEADAVDECFTKLAHEVQS